MKAKKFLLLYAIAFLTLPLAAQDLQVFAPFVTRLHGTVQGNNVHLTWHDSEDVLGSVYIFRSTSPFTEETSYSDLTPVRIPYGTGEYVDNIAFGGLLHYFIAASDENDILYNIPIAPNNTISLLVTLGMSGESLALSLPEVPVQPEIPAEPEVLEIPAEPEIFTQPEVLEVPVQQEIPVQPEIPEQPEMFTQAETPTRPDTELAGLKRPRAFLRDLEARVATTDDAALVSIVRGSFLARNWEAASNQLLLFLAVPRSPETQVRARFYLGQCWYYLYMPREGLLEFMSIQNNHPAEVAE